ncbi:TAT-binding protein-like protein 7, AAA ATPase [Ciborinia camelliae]|nr:TAT-binding protein-like protein 7, AAA ATPase [Ciborinia camelliae]
MPAKKKLDYFDPNKSDSNDDDFSPTEVAPRKTPRKSRSQSQKKGGPRKKNRYRGSDVSEDEDDESLEESLSESEEEVEDFEMNEKTGRAVRKATKKAVRYEEDSNSDEDLIQESEDEVRPASSNKRTRVVDKDDDEDEDEIEEPVSKRNKTTEKKLMVTLKMPRGTTPARRTRAGSTAKTRASAEPTSAGLRRSTRARTEEGEEFTSLSNSGKHIIRASRSPEPIGRIRATRGAKGIKQPAASTIKEEVHETSSYEDPQQDAEGEDDIVMQPEIIGTDDGEDDNTESLNLPASAPVDEDMVDELAVEEAPAQKAVSHDDDDDEPVTRTRTRASRSSNAGEDAQEIVETAENPATGSRRLRTRDSKKKDDGSDFTPEGEGSEEEMTASDASPKKGGDDDGEYSSASRPGRNARRAKSKSVSRRREDASDDEDELDAEELADELQELKPSRRRRNREPEIAYEPKGRRERKQVDYKIMPMDQIYAQDDDAEDPAPSPSRRGRGGRGGAGQPWERNLYTTYGPFGGGLGPAPLIGGPWGTGATGGVDSDDSDDENMQRPIVSGIGMTPTSATMGRMPGLLPPIPQANQLDQAPTGAQLGKVKSQKALADADPLGVDQNVDFSKVGGLEGHIEQLKEMVQMPLLYPELFQKFHVTPPRGVLFHGPPGTGKTLLARALAATVGTGGRKVTFYMRKGADALSKWVGEAEKQLRLLFEEARNTQPSIIFFDEIDGLAPVRSSKQEQIHASIVSTLLALMDGMDGRGQVIVIGATNRPDNIDPALRRPGRFDREFYFPLPGIEGRKSIINIHTKDWGIDDTFKDNLARATKGYGGADLRALCTEAALNSIQRTYPQIYSSNDKLIVDASKIKVTAKDFMLSVKKMVPSSERSTSSGAKALPKLIEPLLRDQLKEIEEIVDNLIPVKKKTTALEEAMYEQYDDEDQGFGRETMQQEFEKSRVFRPRLLIGGEPGMGQAYLGGALLNHFEGLHVQSFDLPTIYMDSARSAESAIVQLFAEVKRHKPSVIYLPAIDTWYHTLPENVITTFLGLLKAIPPTDPVLVLGITDVSPDKVNPQMLRDIFGFSRKNRFTINRPTRELREEFFQSVISYVRKAPNEFPDPANRKKRKLETLELAPPPPPRIPTKEELKAQKKQDHQILNLLKVAIQPIMDQIHRKYKKFRQPVLLQSQIQYLLNEKDPNFVRPDIPQFRPFELDVDKNGVQCLRETATGKICYNLDTNVIEERLANGFYARPKDFGADIRTLAKDAKHFGDKDRQLRTKELVANVAVDLDLIERDPKFADCEGVYHRQLQRTKEAEEKKRKNAQVDVGMDLVHSDVFSGAVSSRLNSPGAINLGQVVPGRRPVSAVPPFQTPNALSNGHSIASGSQHNMTNGSSVPSRASGEDTMMSGTNENASEYFQHSPALPRQQWPPKTVMAPSSMSNRATGFNSQRSAFQEISHDTPLSALINNASPTTSGKKTSEATTSKRTSDGWSTQATNGTRPGASSPIDGHRHDADLPETQRLSQNLSTQVTNVTEGEKSSGETEWFHSQAHALARGNLGLPSQTPSAHNSQERPPVPQFNAPPRPSAPKPSQNSGVADDSLVEVNSTQSSSQKEYIMTEYYATELLENLTDGTSGCSIEQLEQINRELMDYIWKMRGEWNRNKIFTELAHVFNDTILDIEEMQKVLKPSQESPVPPQSPHSTQ